MRRFQETAGSLRAQPCGFHQTATQVPPVAVLQL